jgi:hypothetical protein
MTKCSENEIAMYTDHLIRDIKVTRDGLKIVVEFAKSEQRVLLEDVLPLIKYILLHPSSSGAKFVNLETLAKAAERMGQ